MIKNILVHLARLIVGGLFIFSGFVKLVDPIGSQYKFQEYFAEHVLNIPFLVPYALPFAIILIIFEIVLGVAILIGWKPKLTIFSVLIMLIFFTFLTWYSANYNKVTDCGCFGDAIKLTPWQSFNKDLILLILTLFLALNLQKIKPLISGKIPTFITYLSFFAPLFITYHVLMHLPIIDFRAYAVGKNIPEGMKYKNDGKIPPVHDFMLEDTQNDLAPELLAKEKVMLIIVYNVKKSDKNGFSSIAKIANKAITKGYTVYGVSASFAEDLVLAQTQYNLPFEFLFCDETTLKTMIRANPGIMILEKGTVTQKYNWVDIDKIEL